MNLEIKVGRSLHEEKRSWKRRNEIKFALLFFNHVDDNMEVTWEKERRLAIGTSSHKSHILSFPR